MQPNGVQSIYVEATSERANNIVGTKMIIWPRFDTIRNTWVQEPQPIPSSVFWNGEYELVHPLGWEEGAEGSISMLAAILMLLPITDQF